MLTDDDVYYPGSTQIKRSAGGSGPKIPESEPELWEEMGRQFKLSGKVVTLYPISALAEALERSVHTVRHWDEGKILPPPELRTDSRSYHGRRRLYSHAQVAGLRRIAQDVGLLDGMRVYVRQTNFSERAYQLFATLEGTT